MSNTVVSDKKIYLDYAATTPTDPDVLKKMLPYFSAEYGNPSSLHSSGRKSTAVIARARAEVAQVLNARPEEIIFIGSGTESDNLAVLGVARANRAHGNHIIISAIEHKAVMEAANVLEKEGFSVTILPVDKYGLVSVSLLLKSITLQTILVSIMYANNEIGTVEPIKEIASAIAKYRTDRASHFPFFHTDACQAAGALTLDVLDLGVDLMTVNGSKIYGPKGIGILYKRNGVNIVPTIHGGEQEMNLRAGTESLPLIVGFTEALKKADAVREKESKRLSVLRDYFIDRLFTEIPEIVLNGHKTLRLPNNIHVSIPHVEGESILLLLDTQGIEVSTGSACSAKDLRPSYVLMAIGQDADLIHGSIRFSLGKYTSKKDLDFTLKVFIKTVDTLKKISASNIKK